MRMREELQKKKKKKQFKPFIGKKKKAIGFERKYCGPKKQKTEKQSKE